MRIRRPRVDLRWSGLVALAMAAGPLAGQEWDVSRLGAVAARNIGPAGMSGRVSDVEVVLADPSILYVGSATGGVFKSVDGGVSWTPVFDDQPVLGIGSIAVFQPDPELVWVGTGEGNPRNSAGVGDGIFRSRDGGESWERVGLEGSERIHRVLTHPTDPDIVYAGVMGPAWSDGEVRGVYRTTDGGDTWERVLYVDQGTGVGELVMDPSDPDKLFAGLWDFRRDPWFFRSGGPGSGLWVTEDGGDTWERRTAADGLPEGELGRMGLAVAPSDPNVVYALVEAERSELLRSDDGGRSFRTVNDEPDIASRPFYYADLRVDPWNEDRLYSLYSRATVSEDGCRTFRTVVPSAIIHGDVHELWIDPADPRHMIIGNDGGIGITHDRGDHWRFVENLTLAQYYNISLDDRTPYNIYGGLQDNGSWFGPSDVWENKGILNAHFTRVGGGDGFSVLDDPTEDRFGYSMSQGGSLQRFDRVTGRRTSIQPVHPEGIPLRFNWNAGLELDPHEPGTVYLGSQFVHRTRDRGASWTIISPDLTTDDPAKQDPATGGLSLDATGAETHTTITVVAPSPVEPGVLWVGTDDGNVQLTRDGGATWTEVGRNVRGVPEGTWVPDVHPSAHDPATAYVVFDDHRRGSWETYLYRTRDWGESWERLAETGVHGFAHVLEEDPLEPRLLFLGTEFGLHVSFDGGDSWQRWTHLPAVPVRDMEVHRRDADLVLGTHGRGLWVVDDIRPLRALAANPALTGQPIFAVPPDRAILHETAEAIGYRSTGMAMWQGETRPYGALLTFGVHPDHHGAQGELSVADEAGRIVHTDTVELEGGLNRRVWDLTADGTADPNPDAADGMEVLPGLYTARLEVQGAVAETRLQVVDDPRAPAPSLADRRERITVYKEAQAMVQDVDEARTRVDDALSAVRAVREQVDPDTPLAEEAAAMEVRLVALQEEFFTGPECQGICPGDPVSDRVRRARSRIADGVGGITPLESTLLAQASDAVDRTLAGANELITGDLTEFSRRLEAQGLTPLPDLTPLRRGG
ncbi:MAG: hypothetical protein P8188_12095 [Gemmatimonadota bacterium]